MTHHLGTVSEEELGRVVVGALHQHHFFCSTEVREVLSASFHMWNGVYSPPGHKWITELNLLNLWCGHKSDSKCKWICFLVTLMKCVQVRLTLNHILNQWAHQLIVFTRTENPWKKNLAKAINHKNTSGSGRPWTVTIKFWTTGKVSQSAWLPYSLGTFSHWSCQACLFSWFFL